MAATLRRDEARIDELTGQLGNGKSHASPAVVATWRARAQTGERKLASPRRQRRH
jgi:hypothetical protein